MKRTNEKGFSDAGKENLKGLAVLLGIGFLALFLVGGLIAGVPNATAATANITTGIVEIENTSVIWISVDEGETQLICSGNLCSDVYVDDECPACHECPSINFTELEMNITTRMEESRLLFETLLTAHNSSNLEDEDRTYIDTKVSEGASYSASQVWEYLNQTLMPSRRELENKDELIASLKGSLGEMNNTIGLQGEEIRNYETTTSELKFGRNFAFVIVAIFFILVIFMYASKQGTLGDYRGRIKEGFGGLMPEQTRVRKLQEIEEENEALEEEIKIDDAVRRGEELKRSLQPQGQQRGGAGMEMDMRGGGDEVDERFSAYGNDKIHNTPLAPTAPSAASVAVAAATESGGVSLAKKRKERVMAIINYIEGKEEYAHSEPEILGWFTEKFGKTENTAKLEWGLARNMIEETYLGEMHFIGTPKGGLRFVKNG